MRWTRPGRTYRFGGRYPRHHEIGAKADNVRAARRFVRTCLRKWGLDRLTDIAVLLTSEIVTNAVLHAGPHSPLSAIVVNLTQTAGTTRVEVVDGDIALPVVGSGEVDKQSGRGLLLLDALADSWGVSAGSDEKAVWFELM